mgnify:CR=1 FL=1
MAPAPGIPGGAPGVTSTAGQSTAAISNMLAPYGSGAPGMAPSPGIPGMSSPTGTGAPGMAPPPSMGAAAQSGGIYQMPMNAQGAASIGAPSMAPAPGIPGMTSATGASRAGKSLGSAGRAFGGRAGYAEGSVPLPFADGAPRAKYAEGGGTDPFDAEPARPDLSSVPFFGRQGFRSGVGKLLDETKKDASFPAEMTGAPAALRAIEAYQAGDTPGAIGEAAGFALPAALPVLRMLPKSVTAPAVAGLAGTVLTPPSDTRSAEPPKSPMAARNAEIEKLQTEIAKNQQAAVKAMQDIGAAKFRGVGEEAGMARKAAMDNAAKPFNDFIERAEKRVAELRAANDEEGNFLKRAERHADAARREVLEERKPFNKTPIGEQWEKVGPAAPFIAGGAAALLGRLGHGAKAGLLKPAIEGTAGGAFAANVPLGWDAFFSPTENPEARAFRKYGQELKIAGHPRADEWLDYADNKLPQINPVRKDAQEEFWDPKNYGLGLGKRMAFGAGEGLLGAGMGLATAVGLERGAKGFKNWWNGGSQSPGATPPSPLGPSPGGPGSPGRLGAIDLDALPPPAGPQSRMLPSPNQPTPGGPAPKLAERLPEYRAAAGLPPAPVASPNLSAPKPASSAPDPSKTVIVDAHGARYPGGHPDGGGRFATPAPDAKVMTRAQWNKAKREADKAAKSKDSAKASASGKGNKDSTPDDSGGYKSGGFVQKALDTARRYATGGRVLVGPVAGATGGRTDALPVDVPAGAYVVPADVVSALGEGNTGAGFEKLTRSFGKPGRAAGGAVPIKISDGEFVVTPEQVAKLGNGDMDQGHRVLDAIVKKIRAEHIKTLSELPPPAQS